MSSKFSLILKGSSFRVLQTVVSILIGLLMMPFLIRILGEELYGIWIVIGSVVGTYYLLDLGFNQAVTRYVSKYIHQNNPQAANKVINTALVIYSILGCVVLVVSVMAAQFGAEKLMHNTNNLTLAKTLLIITALTLALEFPSKAFPGIISAYMRYDFLAITRLIKAIIDAVLIYLFLSNGYGLVAMACIAFFTGTVNTLVYVWFTNGLFKELTFSKKLIDMATFKDVFHFSKWVFVLDINALLRGKMDVWFIAFYQSSSVLTVYYVAVRLIEYATQLLNQATGFSTPIFTEYYAKNEVEKLQRALVLFVKVNILLGSIFTIGFMLAGESFIRIWMGATFAYKDAYLCLVLLSAGRFLVYFTAPLQSMLMTLNRHNIVAWISIAETICVLICLNLLTPLYGIYGAAIAMSLPFLLTRTIIIPAIVARIIGLPMAPVAARVIIFIGVTAGYVLSCIYIIPELTQLNLLELILSAPILAVVQLVIGVLLFSRAEKLMIKTLIYKKLRRV